MGKYLVLFGILAAVLLVASACYLALKPFWSRGEGAVQLPVSRATLKIATTTSLDATGLLDILKREFESRHPEIEVTWIAVGTGQALEIARRGDVDLVMTHDRNLEDKFIEEGYGVHAITFACNEFYIVGPPEDPAEVSTAHGAVDAFARIYSAGETNRALFVSRGDKSGTHLKELELWQRAGLSVEGKPWHRETGQGMAQTLIVADQLNAYTLCDSSTYISLYNRTRLKVLLKGDPALRNFYRVIIVNPEKFPWIRYSAAHEFVKFLVSREGQGIVSEYRKGGVQLFDACFGSTAALEAGGSYEKEQVEYWTRQLGG